MPRKYVKVLGNKACLKYTPETLSAAVKSVEEGGISIRQAARQYDVPYGTLHNRFNGLFGQTYGGQAVLTSAEERELCDIIHLAGEWGFPLSQPDIKFLVNGYLNTNQRTTRFKKI